MKGEAIEVIKGLNLHVFSHMCEKPRVSRCTLGPKKNYKISENFAWRKKWLEEPCFEGIMSHYSWKILSCIEEGSLGG